MSDQRYTPEPRPTRNARFWITYRGTSLVKLTMRPGDTIELHEGGATEEGYSHQYSKYEYPKDEAVIYAEFEQSARDCDGRLDTHSESCCQVAELKNGFASENDWPGPGIAFPDWRSARAYQRDYEAEKAGY
ncbi:MAG: hypothetical protein HS116_21190 [Planctomycetes bacterium]|nr:hypothetical protein [Planctomycetota bacterium]